MTQVVEIMQQPRTLEVVAVRDTDAITLRNQAESPLLRLPGEIRNKIYNYALTVDYIGCREYYRVTAGSCQRITRFTTTTYGPPHGESQKSLSQLFNLHTVCRQIHSESRALVFTLNTFRIPLQWLPPFIEAVPKDSKAVLRSLIIVKNSDVQITEPELEFLAGFEALKELPALQKVQIVTKRGGPLNETVAQRVKGWIEKYAEKDVQMAAL